jgi:zinc and cadmium transporter
MLTVVYALLSVLIVSLISLIGIFSLLIKQELLDKILLLLVSLSAGSLFGGVFFHLFPEIIEEQGYNLFVGIFFLSGILFFFILEKFVHWRHCHKHDCLEHPHHLAIMNLVGDGVHNFVDGLVISTSYLANIPLGISTTIAVIAHEVPQEIGDFGVLLYAGWSKTKALAFNFFSALLAVLGAAVGLMLGLKSEFFVQLILPFAAGGFLYIAGSDLLPELHKNTKLKESIFHFLALILGIILMYGLSFLE